MSIPFQKGFMASRSSQGQENRRSLALTYSTNGCIYLTLHEYGGTSMCPKKEDLRWLRDILNQLEFCDHDLGEIARFGSVDHRECKKCGDWIYEGPVKTDIRPALSADGGRS